jgi:ribulose-phosphate 3-epimerase
MRFIKVAFINFVVFKKTFMGLILSPSILNSDFLKLGESVEMLNRSEADWIHLDIMDGVFVPNISFGMPIIAQVKKLAQKPLDVHLMLVHPERYIKAFAEAGADWLTVHYEASTHLHHTIQQIKEHEMNAGVAINPHTPVSSLEEIISEVDMVLVMSVNPGFGGQKMIDSTYDKVCRLKEMIVRRGSNALIQVDGGVDDQNIGKLKAAGVDVFVVGSYIFKSDNPMATIKTLKTV